jgi:hypothetical protein
MSENNYNKNDVKNINEIRQFLDDWNIEYIVMNETSFLLPPKKNDNRTYEINYVLSRQYPLAYPKMGIQGVNKDYFFLLSKEAENNNSFKLWIKNFEWSNERQREVLKSYILHAAYKTPYNWYARECDIRVVPRKEAREFEAKHCFYGKRGASLNLGLYSKKEKNNVPAGTLIMLYTFGLNFFGKKEGIIEVIRVGTLRYSYVSGGSSKLFKYFLNNYKTIQIGNKNIKVKQIKFYSDYDHNIGNSLDKLGFEFDGYSGCGFMNYWIEEDIAKQRQPMKHKWVMEQMRLGKVLSIPNAGIKRFICSVID